MIKNINYKTLEYMINEMLNMNEGNYFMAELSPEKHYMIIRIKINNIDRYKKLNEETLNEM